MTTQALIGAIYSAFNQRDVDRALAFMSEDVNWPKASEGGRVVGKDEVRSYWLRQWKEFDPRVEPLQVTESEAGKVDVRVHQLVKTLNGDLLFDGEVRHIFLIRGGLIERMDLDEGGPDAANPSEAFSRR